MSENSLTNLREALQIERHAHEAVFIAGADAEFDDEEECESETNAALAAVEQEMAALEKDRDHCRRLYLEACELGSGHARIAALEAERDELRKRPTLEEVRARLARLREEEPSNEEFGRYVGQEITDLYSERAK